MKNIKRELEWERELNVECDIVEDHTQQDASNRAKETKAGKTILFFSSFHVVKMYCDSKVSTKKSRLQRNDICLT